MQPEKRPANPRQIKCVGQDAIGRAEFFKCMLKYQGTVINSLPCKEETTMSENILVVPTNPVPGKEDEFSEWYSNIHIQEIC